MSMNFYTNRCPIRKYPLTFFLGYDYHVITMKLSQNKKLSPSSGFTLVELLVVIAVLGVLAAVVLIAINPVEQLARGRDAGRKNGLGQIHNSLQAYYTSHGGEYFPAAVGWLSVLVTAGEIKTVPPAINYSVTGSAGCTTLGEPAVTPSGGLYCYVHAVLPVQEVIVYTRLESSSDNSKCTSPAVAWFLWSSTDSRAGIICNAGEPTALTYPPASYLQ